MRTKIAAIMFTAAVALLVGVPALAQSMMWYRNDANAGRATTGPDAQATLDEEAKGRDILAKLRAGTVRCENLSADDYDMLGEFFMGRMAGSSHAAMNAAMKNTMGEAGETQMHVAMGKRLSGCDENAAYPLTDDLSYGPMLWPAGMMGMMGLFGGRAAGLERSVYPDAWLYPAALWVTMLLVWAVLILLAAALVRAIIKRK